MPQSKKDKPWFTPNRQFVRSWLPAAVLMSLLKQMPECLEKYYPGWQKALDAVQEKILPALPVEKLSAGAKRTCHKAADLFTSYAPEDTASRKHMVSRLFILFFTAEDFFREASYLCPSWAGKIPAWEEVHAWLAACNERQYARLGDDCPELNRNYLLYDAVSDLLKGKA